MPPALVAAASEAAGRHAAQWTGTYISGGGIFWLGLVNVAMLIAFLVVGTQRRDHPTRHPAAASARRAGASPEDEPAGAGQAPATARPTARPMAPLASDAERDRAAARVSRAMAVGQLSVDEGVTRIDAVYASRDRHQLSAVVADLPLEPEPATETRSHRTYRDLRDFAALALGAALVLQFLAGIWEMWPVVVAAMAPFAFGRHRAGRWASGRWA